MKIKALIVLTVVSVIQSAQAQVTDDAPKKSIRISEALIYPSFILQGTPSGTLDDFREIVPQSMILNRDYRSYNQEKYNIIDGETMFTGSIGISFLNKKTNAYRNMTLRIGVSYLSSGFSSALSKYTSIRFDTLNSSHGGASAYIDSARRQSVGMRYTSKDLRADISVVFRTKPEARWGLYGGIGFTAGASINAYTDIHYDDHTTLETTYDGTVTSSAYNHYTYEPETERYKSKGSTGYSVYIPLGIDYRMANRSEFWKRLHVFYEAKPLVNFAVIEKIGMVSNVGIQNGVGLRATF